MPHTPHSPAPKAKLSQGLVVLASCTQTSTSPLSSPSGPVQAHRLTLVRAHHPLLSRLPGLTATALDGEDQHPSLCWGPPGQALPCPQLPLTAAQQRCPCHKTLQDPTVSYSSFSSRSHFPGPNPSAICPLNARQVSCQRDESQFSFTIHLSDQCLPPDCELWEGRALSLLFPAKYSVPIIAPDT